MVKDFVPLDSLANVGLNPYELVTVAAKEARNINKVRIVEKEQNPESTEEPTEYKVYVEALDKVLNGEVEYQH